MPIPIIRRDPILDQEAFEAFSCDVPHANPATPDRVPPNVSFVRDFEAFDIPLPDGERVEVWSFGDRRTDRQWPAPVIRVREGQVVHTTLHSRLNTHTIHHHGIEPTTFNDGVGHTSFEVTGEYTYQFQAAEAGTYFYHCHKNTVLHFEMGKYGFLIIDPRNGEGFVRRINAVVPYQVEALWATDEIDPRWHELNHDAGLKCPNGEDARLNEFDPRYFFISGVPSPWTEFDPRVVIDARVGQTIALRVLNAGYTRHRFRIQGLGAEVIEIDGRTLGFAPLSPYSAPFTIPAGTPFELTTAQRWNLLIRPSARGTFPVTVEFRDWITGRLYHTARSFIRVT